MNMAYVDENLFHKIVWFIIEKLDILVEMPREKEVF